MSARATVSDDEVVAAGRALAAEGSPVSGWSLRRVVGRGDPARLQAVWGQHQTEAGSHVEATPGSVTLPPVVVEAVEVMRGRVGDLAADLWRAAERLASERAHGEAEAARAETATLRHQLDQAAVALAAADEARDAAEERAERLAVIEAQATAWYDDVERRVATADARAAAAEAETARVREDMRAVLDAIGRVGVGGSGVAAG